MRRSAFALALAAHLAGGVRAQEPEPGKPPQEHVFRTEVHYVEVDAFVMDARGEFLHHLTRDDFQVFEEGVRQDITAFAEISIPIERPEETRAEAEALPRDTATNEHAFGGRVYVFLLDAAHTDPRRSTRVREIASQFIEAQMAKDDVAAVVITGDQPGAGQTFTSDKRLLLEAVSRFAGGKPASATVERLNLIEFQRETAASRGREPSDSLAPVRGRDLDPLDLERAYNARQSMETLQSVARGLGAAQGRRKTILYFTEGIDYDTLDVMHRMQRDASSVLYSVREAIASATRYGVTVFPIDPRGLISGLASDDIQMKAPVDLNRAGPELAPEDLQVTASASRAGLSIDFQSLDREVQRSLDSLRTLATLTGGFAVVDTNAYEPAYDRIVRANSQYYLMGYYPSDFRRDGAYRRIEVRVSRPGVTVVAREGYMRPRKNEQERPRVPAAADTSPEVRELLDRPWAETGLTLGVTAAAFKGAAGVASVAVTIELAGEGLPFRQENDRAVNEIEVSLLALDHEGRVRGGDRMLAQPRLLAQTRERVGRLGMRFVRRLDLPPGRYQLRVAAREAEQGKRGSVFYDIEVPDYQKEPPVMSGVLVTSRLAPQTLTASMDDQVQQLLGAPPTVARAFEAGDVVRAYAEVYDEPEPARAFTLTTRVTSANGGVVFRSTEERASLDLRAGGRLAYEVEVPLATLDPGQYVLQIEARPSIGEASVARALTFDVVPSTGTLVSGDLVVPSRSASRIDRLETWLAAVEQHEPGTADAPARIVRSWTPEELTQLATDLSLLARLIEDPKHPVLWLTDPERPTRFFRAPYSTDDDARLRTAARDASLRCGQDPGRDGSSRDEQAVRCARNRLLKRGAVLHTDAAIRFEDEAAASYAGRPALWRVRYSDGRQRAAQGAPGHWELARSLLENVAPSPEEDDTVRLWYIATSAHGQYYERQTRHEEQAVEMFPEDAQVLFLAACLHETFASPTIQSLARSIHVSGTRHGIESEKSELRKAEKLFRRALTAEPALVEARIRLGRVLHLLGQPEDAARELRQAVATLLSGDGSAASPDSRLLLYLAEMFYGAAAEELGQRARAQASYARAAELYPDAPSPRLALSQLALHDNDQAAALDAVQRAMQPPPGGRDRDDPWWRYHAIQGRDASAWFARLYRSLADGT
jgi:VWFA-related protein